MTFSHHSIYPLPVCIYYVLLGHRGNKGGSRGIRWGWGVGTGLNMGCEYRGWKRRASLTSSRDVYQILES